MSKRKKKMTGYKKSLLIWFLLLLIASEACLIYVSTTLKMYEKGNIEGYMTSLIKDMKTASKVGNINKYLSYNKVESKYEKNSSFEEGYKELFNESKLSYKKNDKENTYDIYADDTMIASVTLDSKKVRRLGILSFEEYSIKEIETYSKNGIYNIDVYVNSNYDLYINDVKVSDDDLLSKEEIKEYSEVYNKVDLPYENHYKITNLTKKPKIKVMNGNNEVKVTNEKSNYYGVTYFKTDDKDAAFEKLTNKDYDPLFAKNWSLFLTADLPGERYGLYTLTPNLVEGTALYKRAYSWATNVDITFTSLHTLDKDTFTNVKMNGFTVYNENAFSVDIYLEKNMTLVNGEKRVDTLNDTFYYAYIDGAYRLITMKSKGDN